MKQELWKQPVFFARNRVFRVYQGGLLFHDFLGDAEEDGYFPEEWIASDVHAINPGHDDPLKVFPERKRATSPSRSFFRKTRNTIWASGKTLAFW